MDRKAADKYFIQEHLLREGIFHGGIGNKDIERILTASGFTAIEFPFQRSFSFRAKMKRLAYLLQLLFTLPSKATIVFQHPLHAQLHRMLVALLKRFKPSLKIICFITDINGMKDADEELLQIEMSFFRKLDHFIVHNEKMKQWLLSFHPAAKATMIEFFDYLAEPNSSERKKDATICFAGFMDKSRFVTQLNEIPGLRFELYGPGAEICKAPHVQHHGSYEPGLLPQKLDASFGLVWDGDSINGLEGTFGKYNKYISPHKLSLYIISGLPVIAHENSGSAALVKKYQLGITVSSLHEVPQRISDLPEVEYQQMRKNCLQLSEKISTGGCLKNAIMEIGNN